MRLALVLVLFQQLPVSALSERFENSEVGSAAQTDRDNALLERQAPEQSKSLPTVLYRADTRPPKEIEKAGGFLSRGGELTADSFSVYSHARGAVGGGAPANSAYVSTTNSQKVAAAIVHNKPHHVYEIQATPNIFSVQDTLGRNNPFPGQREYVAMGGIRWDQVKSYSKMKAVPNSIVPGSKDFASWNPSFDFRSNEAFQSIQFGSATPSKGQPQLAGYPTSHSANDDPIVRANGQKLKQSGLQFLRESQEGGSRWVAPTLNSRLRKRPGCFGWKRAACDLETLFEDTTVGKSSNSGTSSTGKPAGDISDKAAGNSPDRTPAQSKHTKLKAKTRVKAAYGKAVGALGIIMSAYDLGMAMNDNLELGNAVAIDLQKGLFKQAYEEFAVYVKQVAHEAFPSFAKAADDTSTLITSLQRAEASQERIAALRLYACEMADTGIAMVEAPSVLDIPELVDGWEPEPFGTVRNLRKLVNNKCEEADKPDEILFPTEPDLPENSGIANAGLGAKSLRDFLEGALRRSMPMYAENEKMLNSTGQEFIKNFISDIVKAANETDVEQAVARQIELHKKIAASAAEKQMQILGLHTEIPPATFNGTDFVTKVNGTDFNRKGIQLGPL